MYTGNEPSGEKAGTEKEVEITACEYRHPLKTDYRCPFAAAGEFEGMKFCPLHMPGLPGRKRVPAELMKTVERMIAEREISELPEWSVPRVNLEGRNLRDFELFRVFAPRANLSWALLDRAAVGFTDLTRAQLKLACGKGARFVTTKLTAADLTAADFSNSIFRQCSLDDAKLTNVVFRLAEIVSCDLSRTAANKADFSAARIMDTDFSHAKLRKACFKFARLVNVDFSSADLRGADFTGAELEKVVLTGALLDGTKGLDLSR